MPLVKRIQETYGKDKLAVLLLSIDQKYSFGRDPADEDRQALKEVDVDWDNVLVPGGFDTLLAKYNLDGYGLTLIDPDGIVRGADIRAQSIEPLLQASTNSK